MSKRVKLHAPNMPWDGAKVIWRTGPPPSDGWYLTQSNANYFSIWLGFRHFLDARNFFKWSVFIDHGSSSKTVKKIERNSGAYRIEVVQWCDWRPSK
jgi:hypothetical protein